MITTAEGTVNLLYAPYLDGYGYPLATIGTLAALFAILRLLSRVPSGALYRPARAKPLLVAWLIVFTLSTSGFFFAGGLLPLVIALTVVHGFAFGSLGTVNLATTIDLAGGRRAGTVMGWYTAGISTGYALGAFLGGALADRIGIPAALAILGVVPAIASLLVLRMPPIAAPPHEAPRGTGIRGILAEHAHVDPRVWLAFVVVVYVNVLSDGIDSFFPIFALSVGLPLAASGALKGLKSGAATFIRFISGGIFRYLDHRTVNFWAVIAMGVSTFFIPVLPVFGVLLVFFTVNGISRGILRVTTAATVAEVRAEGQNVGVASAVYNAGLDIGAIIGPALGGFVASALGIGPMFQILAAGALVLYFAVALSTARGRATLPLFSRGTRGS